MKALKRIGICISIVVFNFVFNLEDVYASRAKIASIATDPYVSAIVVDADSGKIIYEDHSDEKAYPASVLKLMDFLIILEKLKDGAIKLDDKITVTAEVAKIGGSQVYLKEGEVFTVDELLYALMIQSANDAATALAVYIGGSKEGFIELMNQRAKELGMSSSSFNSIHGLPPEAGIDPDVTTARDLAILCRELLKFPETLKYTSVISKGFRNGEFTMHNHNNLLGSFEGCDGLKTGYYKAAGYSIAATAKRGKNRVIAVVLGSNNKKLRDRKAAELLTKGFMSMPKK